MVVSVGGAGVISIASLTRAVVLAAMVVAATGSHELLVVGVDGRSRQIVLYHLFDKGSVLVCKRGSYKQTQVTRKRRRNVCSSPSYH